MTDVTITVRRSEKFDADFPSANLIEFAGWVDAAFAEIPEEYRPTAMIELGAERNWDDDPYASVTITYRRPETDIERSAREFQEKLDAERTRAHKLQQLERLKAELGETER